MYESAAQQDELCVKVHDFLRGYERLQHKYHPEDTDNDIPTYLLLTLGPQFGTCPYLHPKYGHQTRLDWLDLIHRHKFAPSGVEVIRYIKTKYITRTEIKEMERLCKESSEKVINDVNTNCCAIWSSIESQISQWLIQSSKETMTKKEVAALLNSIVAVCTQYQCNFLHIYQVTKEVKVPAFALKKADFQSNLWTDSLVQLEKSLLEKKDAIKRLEKEIFQSKKKLFEISESNYICGRVGKINSTYARLDHNTKIDRILEVCFHHSSRKAGCSTVVGDGEHELLLPHQVDSILAYYNENLALDHYLSAAWNKKGGIFEELPFEEEEGDAGTKWSIRSIYISDFVPNKTTKVPKTPLFKPYQSIVQHLLLVEIAQSTQPLISQQQLMHRVLARFPLAQKAEAYEYGMKILEKLNK